VDDPGGNADLTFLLGRCAAGDQNAFRMLYDRQAPRLYAIALRITRQPASAEDAVHDAFVQVWQNAGRYDPARGNPEAWMISLTRYRALDLVRRNAREVTGMELPDEADPAPDPLRQAETRVLQGCLELLETERRRLVVLAFVDGYSHSELAALFKLPLGTVKSWIRRSLETLRRCLDA
jgi:RNA polymerase sigma-70 factor (ECF subfamily)